MWALPFFVALPLSLAAQDFSTPVRTIRTSRQQVVALAVAPKGDRLLMGSDKGGELLDMEKGRRLQQFAYEADGSTVVYHAAFNANGEKLVLIGHSGKRRVWNITTGEEEKVLRENLWIPEATAVRAMGLDMKNSSFDRFYQQTEAAHGDLRFRSAENGAVQVLRGDKPVTTITIPENKDRLYRAPLLVYDDQLLVGTDDGRVLFYALP
jgi:WD40 repeat protein